MKFSFIDITGQRFGRMTALRYVGKNERNLALWECICDCGKTKVIAGAYLRRGEVASCGCYALEVIKTTNTKHGLRQTRFYRIWHGMKNRCDNSNVREYPRYGGRGIKYCEAWADFINFKNDMYESYLQHCEQYGEYNTTLERIDNNKGYSKENCRWATIAEQQNNTRYNHKITYKGKKYNLKQAALEFNIPMDRLWHRLNSGWDIEKALTTPVIDRIYEFGGIKATLPEHCKRLGLKYNTVVNRIGRLGWPLERALTEPIKNTKSKERSVIIA